jgi:hypothetical protein
MLHALRILIVVFACGILLVPARADDDLAPAEPGDGEGPAEPNLSGVTDRSELAFEESPAYYALLDRARNADPAELQQRAEALLQQRWEDSPRFHQFPLEEFPLFYDLTQHPEQYRGQPVHMRGHLIRLVKYAAGPNVYGIDTLYEGWLVTPDAETHPTTVICTGIPDGMPIGEELIDGVRVTGYFFKLHTYSSRDNKVRFAPMVLAHRLHWSPVAGAPGWPVSQTAVVLAVLALAAVAVGIAWMNSRRSAAAKQQRLRESIPESAPEFLNDLSP